MATVTIDVSDEEYQQLAERARAEGLSASEYIARLLSTVPHIEEQPDAGSDHAESERQERLRKLWGSWEDDRTVEEILADIDDHYGEEPERAQFD